MTATTARPLSASTDSLLRFALRADAILTGLGGVAVATAATPVAALTGLSTGWVYGFSAFFVLYGLVVFGLAALPAVRRPGIGVIVVNLAYTVAMVALVETALLPLTGVGVAAMLGGGGYTLFFAVLQYRGVRRLAG